MTSVIISAVFIAGLAWLLLRELASNRIQHLVDARRPASRLVSRGEFIDDGRHLPVSMALTDWALHYESPDMQACLDLEWVQDVEYDDQLVTGRHIGDGNVLRLHCFGQVFEFILPEDALPGWRKVLPPRRAADSRPPAPAGDVRAEANAELSRAEDDGLAPAVAQG